MSITYPVDVGTTKWAVLQISTGQIIARNKTWPVADGSAIPGMDPDFVYLLHVNDTPPDYDYRYYTLQATETPDASGNTLTKTYSTVKRPTPDQIASAENEEAARLSTLINVNRELLQTRLMVGAILAYIVDSQQFPTKVRNMADNYVAKATRIWQNRDRLNEIIDQINQGLEPDLDAGWEED